MNTGNAQRYTTLQKLLARERIVLLAVVVLVAALSWAWIIAMSLDMYGAMDGWSAWMMTSAWDSTYFILLWAMWAVMMSAMMLPSATPTILLYLRTARAKEPASTNSVSVYALLGGYLAVWSFFSVIATGLQWLLASLALMSPMMESASPIVTAVLLTIAGLYQFTPLKRSCLRACRSPLSFLMQHWQTGTLGAFRMGLQHGTDCLGCCWALMLLLFAGGVMHLGVITALTAWVILEKLLPLGQWVARAGGIAMIIAAAWVLLR